MLVVFDEVKNARGYPLTAEVLEGDGDGTVSVKAFGLYGPGVEAIITGVPVSAIRECSWVEDEP